LGGVTEVSASARAWEAGNYFEAEQREYLDCAPRTRFGLHNAFTRAIKQLAPAPAFEANLGLGSLFGLN
jgi:hypothetical protein